MRAAGLLVVLALTLQSVTAAAASPTGGVGRDASQVQRNAAATRSGANTRDDPTKAVKTSSASASKSDAKPMTREARRATRWKNFKQGMAGVGMIMTPFAVIGSLGAGAMIGHYQNLQENRTLDRVPYVQLEHAAGGSMDAKFNTLANFPRVSPQIRDHDDMSGEARAGFDKLSSTLLNRNSEFARSPSYANYLAQAIHSGESLASDIHARADKLRESADTTSIDAAITALKQRQADVIAHPTVSNPNPGDLRGPASIPASMRPAK